VGSVNNPRNLDVVASSTFHWTEKSARSSLELVVAKVVILVLLVIALGSGSMHAV